MDLNFKQSVKNILLGDMLGSLSPTGTESWKILVVDPSTTQIISSFCKMSEVIGQNISVIEDISKKRAKQPYEAIYFIQPIIENVQALIQDANKNIYSRFYVYFSRKVPNEVLAKIKSQPKLVAKLKALQEMYLEYSTIDEHTFITNQPDAIKQIYGEHAESSGDMNRAVQDAVQRLSSVFLSLKELPAIRFKHRGSGGDSNTMRAMVAQRIATDLHDSLAGTYRRMGQDTEADTCDLILVDRSFDALAPVMHEWTYECMLYDIIGQRISNGIISQEYMSGAGKKQTRDVALDDENALWLELRHQHFADCSSVVPNKLKVLQEKNKLAQYKAKGGSSGGGGGSAAAMALSANEYTSAIDSIGLHYGILSDLTKAIDQRQLMELGQVEEGIVYGEFHSKDIISFLQGHGRKATNRDKQRLLMAYSATHPEKLDKSKQSNWQKLSNLTDKEMSAVTNLQYLGVSVTKKSGSSKTGLAFGQRKAKAVRIDAGGTQKFTTGRFQPLLQDIVEGHLNGSLSQEDFPWVKAPSPSRKTSSSRAPQSVRRGGFGGWAGRKASQQDPGSSKTKQRRVFVFVLGGLTRSEMRCAHQIGSAVDREIVVGGTHIISPDSFVESVEKLSDH